MDPDFQSFIVDLGIDKLPEQDQQGILEIALETVYKRVLLRISRELTDEQAMQFEEASKQGDRQALAALEQIYPNYKQVYREELDGLKRDMLAVTPGPHRQDVSDISGQAQVSQD